VNPTLSAPTLAALDACLPQTQCQRCGYPNCEQYAQALLDNQTALNRCPPGGEATLMMLAELLHQPLLPLAPELMALPPHQPVAIIEAECIGCTLCIQACPVDAIIGAPKKMHTVLLDWCTGCALCLAACPVDCMHSQPAKQKVQANSRWPEFSERQVAQSRQRYRVRSERLQRRLAQHRQQHQRLSQQQLQNNILAAVARTRARRSLVSMERLK